MIAGHMWETQQNRRSALLETGKKHPSLKSNTRVGSPLDRPKRCTEVVEKKKSIVAPKVDGCAKANEHPPHYLPVVPVSPFHDGWVTILALVNCAITEQTVDLPRNHPIGNHPIGNPPIGNHPIGNHPIGNHPIGNHRLAISDWQSPHSQSVIANHPFAISDWQSLCNPQSPGNHPSAISDCEGGDWIAD